MKINFNVKSAKAWGTLISAIIGAVISILAAFGIIVNPTDTSTFYSAVTAVLSLLAATGILIDTNKPTGGDKGDK